MSHVNRGTAGQQGQMTRARKTFIDKVSETGIARQVVGLQRNPAIGQIADQVSSERGEESIAIRTVLRARIVFCNSTVPELNIPPPLT